MAQSPTERITALERLVAAHAMRQDGLADRVNVVFNAHAETAKEFVVLKRDFDRELALLKREVEELKKWQEDVKKGKEEWGRRLWLIVPAVLAVLISNALTLLISLYFRK